MISRWPPIWLLASWLAIIASPTSAQQPGCVSNGPCTATQVFTPSGQAIVAVSSVSSRTPFPSTGSNVNLMATNTATTLAYLRLGSSGVVATVADIPIQPGQTLVFPQGTNTNIAVVTASGVASLLIQSGTGTPVIVQGSVSGGGGGGGGGSVAFTATSKSGTITLGGAAQVLMAANSNRVGCVLQPQTGDLWYNTFGGTAAAVQPSYNLPAPSVFTCPPGFRGAISIFGAITGQTFAAEEDTVP
jgi:hypothetical protein